MYSISLQDIQAIIFQHQLHREVVSNTEWLFRVEDSEQLTTQFNTISYNSKDADETTLFFCKGMTFKKEYLEEAVQQGVTFYISEKVYDIPGTVGIIVSDIRKVMSLIARKFYDFPDEKLNLIGITGTKGKTTTTYFTQYVLNEAYPKKTAVISTIGVNLDGEKWTDTSLTTPESLDLFRMIATAAEEDMDYLIMEVSSQAFKMDRVFGLTFDIGVFLNISPDHIGPNEHPTMEDYFYCKRQLLSVSNYSVINSNTEHFNLLKQQADFYSEKTITYGTKKEISDYTYKSIKDFPRSFKVTASNQDELNIEEAYSITIPGDFNQENALCAAIVSSLLGSSKVAIGKGLNKAFVPGRMEHFILDDSNHVYVDFAHNYISLKSVLDFAVKEHTGNKLTIVIGAPGGKGHSRRKDFGLLLSEYEGTVYLTADDPNEEKPREISEEIGQYISGNMKVSYIDNRIEAIHRVLEQATKNETIVIAGKGTDDYLIVNNTKEPYKGDHNVVKEFIEQV